jgi:hypothetical protein
MLKTFRFWITFFSLLVVLYNIMGKDDKNLLMFFTSPPFWMTEYFRIEISMSALYFLTVVFWFLFGWAIDYGVSKLKRR